MTAAQLIPSLVADRVVVVGSLPPGGRDLDLLVRPAEAEALATGLAEAGYGHRGKIWARFESCGADVVDITPADTWRLPDDELDSLFGEAIPIEPQGRLCRPAARHSLLILARRTMREGPRLREKRRERVAAELAEDPDAFERARERAPAWGAVDSLDALEAAFRSGEPLSAVTRRRAVATELAGPLGSPRARIASWRAVLRRPRRGPVIAFSGLDGSGKSTQVEALAGTLELLGADTAIAWSSVAFNPPWLRRVQAAVKSLLMRAVRLSGRRPAPVAAEPGAPKGSEDPGQALRRQSGLLTFAWSLTVTLVLAGEVMRRIWPPRLQGRVVICDRHLLDAWAHLLYQYGEERRYGLQLAILRAVFPRPRLAYFLDVPAETAARRKQDYDAAQNARRAGIYRRQAAALGVRVLDGERPAEELCSDIAREVWAAVG